MDPSQSLLSLCSQRRVGSCVIHAMAETGCMREKKTPASGCQPLGLEAPSLLVQRYFIFHLLIFSSPTRI